MVPSITILAEMGRRRVVACCEVAANFDTDLLLLTKFAGMHLARCAAAEDKVPPVPAKKKAAKRSASVVDSISFDFVSATKGDALQQHQILIGKGRHRVLDRAAISRNFSELIDQAIKLGADNVTIPFPSRTSVCSTLNFALLADILKRLVTEKFAEFEEPAVLRGIVILCSRQAEPYVRAGLNDLVPISSSGAGCLS